MAATLVPLQEVATRIGMRAKQLRALCAEHGLNVTADECEPQAVATLLERLPVAHQRHIRAHQVAVGKISKRGWEGPYSVLAPFRPMGFKPAAEREGRMALAMPLTYPARSHASMQELARWWGIPEGSVRALADALKLERTAAGGNLAELYDVVDLIAKQEGCAPFQQLLAELHAAQRKESGPERTDYPTSKANAARGMKAAHSRSIPAGLGKRERAARRAQLVPLEAQIAARVTVNVQARTSVQAPETAIFYAGATNSGKTYAALADLSEAFERSSSRTPAAFVYAGPLRMLAHEVYQKLVARHGAENVGFLTGEEQVNPQAPIVACTVEMAPKRGEMLVLDESHWIVEPSRGEHWTNLLLGSTYRSYHVLTAREALPTLQLLLSDSRSQEVREFERKTPLVYRGTVSLADVPARSAVVAFSRKAVYAIASMLERQGRKVGVVYGALPLAVRREQIERYLRGEYEVMVVTDVIGHGINLPIDHVVFAQSEKFDGVERRNLRLWEVAQIAGRAGRFGLSAEGGVHLLTGRDWFSRDEDLIRRGTAAGAGTLPTDLAVGSGMIAPAFSDLHVSKPEEFPVALAAWVAKATAVLADTQVRPSGMQEVQALLLSLSEAFELSLGPTRGKSSWPVSAADLWQLISGPFDPKGEAVKQVFRWLAAGKPENFSALDQFFQGLTQPLAGGVVATGLAGAAQVSELEKHVGSIRELKMARVMFTRLGPLLLPELLEAEDRLNEAIDNALGELIVAGVYGTCRTCGEPASPWFGLCEDCHWFQRRR